MLRDMSPPNLSIFINFGHSILEELGAFCIVVVLLWLCHRGIGHF